MKRTFITFSGAILVYSSCSTVGSSGEIQRPVEDLARVEASLVRGDSPAPSILVKPASLDIWKDERFQKQFALSYLSDVDTEPNLTKSENELLAKVRDLMSNGQLDQAGALLEDKRSESSSATLDYWAGNVAAEREMLREAAEAYEVAVDKYPKFRRAWEHLGQAYYRLSQAEDTVRALTRVLEFGGGKAITFGLLGYSYLALRNYLAAESALRMAVMLDGGRKEWKRGLADALFGQKRYAESISLLDSLIAEEPERAGLWLQQGSAYLAMNEPLKAAQNFEMVELLGQSTTDSLLILGNIHSTHGVYDLAAQAYLRAIELSTPEKLEQVFQGARFLVSRNATEEARTLVDAVQQKFVTQLSTEQQRSLIEIRARIAGAEGLEEERREILTQMIELDPRDGQALLQLGDLYVGQGDGIRAVNCFERAASIEEFERQAKLKHGQYLVNQGKPEEALSMLRRAQTIEPNDKLADYIRAVEQRIGAQQ